MTHHTNEKASVPERLARRLARVATKNHHDNEKAPGAINTEGLATDTTNDLDFATGERPSKAIATLIAELAIRGHAVHQLQDGGFFVCNHGQSHYAPDFYALQRFAIKVGASQ
jgi:hypothetical protein